MDKKLEISDEKVMKIAGDISENSDDRSLETITRICKKNGVTIEGLIGKLNKISSAKRIFLGKQGEEHEDEDWANQLKATMALVELLGFMKKGPLVEIIQNISTEEREIIDMYGRYSN